MWTQILFVSLVVILNELAIAFKELIIYSYYILEKYEKNTQHKGMWSYPKG